MPASTQFAHWPAKGRHIAGDARGRAPAAAAMQNYPGPPGGIELTVGLVQASPQCTGS
jgi:hypothetical protein